MKPESQEENTLVQLKTLIERKMTEQGLSAADVVRLAGVSKTVMRCCQSFALVDP